jgi:hypothetical protein
MEKKTTWEDWVNLLLGAWIFIIPWTINHGMPNLYMSVAMWNFWIVGALTFATAALALQNIKPWEELTNLALGLWLMASPWMFGYNTQSGLLWNSVVVGLAVSVLSCLALPIAQRRQARVS